MESCEFDSCIRGYHVYRSIWTPTNGEVLVCARETGNRHDPFSVKVIKSATIVGHLPKRISSTCSLFLRMGGSISCEVTGPKQYSADLIQGGLEIPCRLMLSSSTKELIEKAKKLLGLCGQKMSKSETTKAASFVLSESKEFNFLNNAQSASAVNGNPAKKIKLEDSKGDASHDQWLYHELGKVRLTKEDKNAIADGKRLNDKHISFAQNVLKIQFPEIEGLKQTILQERFKLDSSKHIVQILHVHGDHWITISNLKCDRKKIIVYDSVYFDIDEEVKGLINNLFDKETEAVTSKEMPKQKGGSDCGVYAIAVATTLLHGTKIEKYKSSLMRSHLIRCFENFQLTTFPVNK